MKKPFNKAIYLIVALLLVLSYATKQCSASQEKTFVILNTNDIHAQIDKFPALMSAVEQCRDTVETILVDAGDRWTGNAFVDLVDNYAPLYELFNKLQYDVTVYGNHEFDKGQAYLAASNRQAEFPILGANIVSDTTSFPQPSSHIIIEREGKKIAFVGVIGNYAVNGHPSGKDESYVGVTFTDPYTTAAEYAYLKDECDMVVLVSHTGYDEDVEFAGSELSKGYDMVISAHSHTHRSEMVGDVLVAQSGSKLYNIGATVVTITSDGEVKMSYQNIPLKSYEPNAEIAELVEGYHANPELNATIGSASEDFGYMGVRNMFTEAIRARTNANIGVYNSGGVRVNKIPKGDISMATVLNAEPFNAYIATMTMSVAQIKDLIMTKYNSHGAGESHSIDLIFSTPYTVITGDDGNAVDVIFPELDEEKTYKIAIGDYVYKTYKGLHYTNGKLTDILVAKTIEDYIKANPSITPDNSEHQSITPQSELKK